MELPKCSICGKVILDCNELIIKTKNGEVKKYICDKCSKIIIKDTYVYKREKKIERKGTEEYLKIAKNIPVYKFGDRKIEDIYIIVVLD